MERIYLNTQQLGPYNISSKLAFELLQNTARNVYVFRNASWKAAELWPELLKKDFDGRIDVGDEKPTERDFIINYKSRVSFTSREIENGLDINSEYLKFDHEIPCSEKRIRELNSRLMAKNPVVVFGSVWHHELPILKYFMSDLREKDYSLIVAPRHLDKVPAFLESLRDVSESVGRRSSLDTFGSHELLVLDTLGELKELYGIGSVNVVCGGFEPQAYRGGHNPLESLVFSKPTLIGPDYSNHGEVVRQFRNSHFLEVCSTNGVMEMNQKFEKLEKIAFNKKAQKKIESFKKHLQRISGKTDRFVCEIVKKIQ